MSITRYASNELEAIVRSTANKRVFKKHSDTMRRNLVTINSQLSIYEKRARDAVEQEIYEELLEEPREERSTVRGTRLPPFPVLDKVDVNVYERFCNGECSHDTLSNEYHCYNLSIGDFQQAVLRWKQDSKAILKALIAGMKPMDAKRFLEKELRI